MRRLLLALGLLLASSILLAGCGKSDEEAIRDSVNGFAAAYNSGDYQKCTEYLQGIDDSTREGAMSTLGLARAVVQSIEVTSITDITIEGSSATAEVTARATMAVMWGGNSADETVTMSLTRQDGKWKFDFDSLKDELMAGLASALR